MALQIRQTTYRNEPGFLVCGKHSNSGIFGTAIFTKTRKSAELIRDKVKRGENIKLQDFLP